MIVVGCINVKKKTFFGLLYYFDSPSSVGHYRKKMHFSICLIIVYFYVFHLMIVLHVGTANLSVMSWMSIKVGVKCRRHISVEYIQLDN